MILFLYGQDSFRSREKLNQLKEKFIRDVDKSGNSIAVLDGAKANMGEISEKISPSSLLSSKRMIIIEEIFQNKATAIFAELADFLKKADKNQDNIIILTASNIKVKKTGARETAQIIDASGKEKAMPAKHSKLFKFLKSGKYVQEFSFFSNREAASWAKREIESRGARISIQAVNLLTSLAGNDLWQLNNEINKLVNYKEGQEPKLVSGGSPVSIEKEDVEELVRGQVDENIFALTDAISAKNKANALKLLEDEFEAGMTDSYLLSMVIRQFKILLQIRVALDSGLTSRKIISALKLHPFVAQKGINQVRNFTLDQLKNLISKLVAIDNNMKTGKSNVRTMLDVLFVES